MDDHILVVHLQVQGSAHLELAVQELCTQEVPARGMCRDIRVPEEAPIEIRNLMDACVELDPMQRPDATVIINILLSGRADPNESTVALG